MCKLLSNACEKTGRLLECAALNHHPSPDGYAHHCDVFQPHQLQNVDGYVEADDRYSFYWKYCLNSRLLECAALNHHPSPDGYAHHCDVFQPHQLQNVDGYVEADDRYSFYWKYCLNSELTILPIVKGYAFTYHSDRYMDARDVTRVIKKGSLEECLVECLDEKSIHFCVSECVHVAVFRVVRFHSIEQMVDATYQRTVSSLNHKLSTLTTTRISELITTKTTATTVMSDTFKFEEQWAERMNSCQDYDDLKVLYNLSIWYLLMLCQQWTKAMSEASTTSRSETTTKNDTSSPHQKTSTTKAKLFKQTYPLPLTTTSEPPTQTSDTTFKQVLQQIIRAHIVEESQIVQNFKRSRSSLSVDDQSIPLLSQLAPPVFRSQFQAPIFDFFSRLAAHDDALESFPTTTTTSAMESDLPLIPDSEQESSAELPNEAEKSIISSGQVSSGTIDIQAAEPASTEPSSSDRQLSPIFSNSPILSTTVAPKTSNGSRPNDGADKGEDAFELATTVVSAKASSQEESDNFIGNATGLGNRTEATTIPTLTVNINNGTRDVEIVMPLKTGERDIKQGEEKSLSHPSTETRTLLKDTDAAKNVKTDSPGLLSNKELERIPAIERHHSLPSSKDVLRLRLGQKGVSVRKVGDKRIALQNFSSNRTIWNESPAPAADATKELIEGRSVLLKSSSAADRKNMRGRTQKGEIEDSDPKVARTMATAPIKSMSFSKRNKSSHPRKQLTPSLQTKSRSSEGNAMTELVSATLEVRPSNPVVDRSLAKLHRAESPVRASQEPIRNKNVGTTKKTQNRIGEKRRKIAAVHKIRNPKLILRRNSLMIPIKRGHNLAIPPNPKIAAHRNRNVNRSSLNVSVDASEKSLKETGREQLGVLKAARVLSHGKVPTATDGPKTSLTLKLQNEIAQLTQAAVDQDSNGLNSTQLSGRVAALLRLLAASVESAKEGSAKRSAVLPSSIERQPTKDRAAPVKSKIGFSAAAALARDVARNKQEISTSQKGLHSTKPTRTPMRQVLPAPQKVHLAPRSPLSKFGSLHASNSILSINQKFPARLINSPKSKSRAAPTRPLPRAIPLSSKFLKLPTTPESSAALQKILRATKTPSSRTLFHHSRRFVSYVNGNSGKIRK
ncbi:hypothetical protein OSTOST_02830 [Ostertagia ostertagi]